MCSELSLKQTQDCLPLVDGVKLVLSLLWTQSHDAFSLAPVAGSSPSKKSLFSPRYDEFLKLLKAARENAGLSQRETAQKMDRTQSFVAKSETGERRVDVIELIDFLRAYEVRPEKFIREL